MSLVTYNGSASRANTTTKHAITSDIDNIIERVTKVLKGDVKFLDANQKQTSAALKRLQEAKGYLELGLISTDKE